MQYIKRKGMTNLKYLLKLSIGIAAILLCIYQIYKTKDISPSTTHDKEMSVPKNFSSNVLKGIANKVHNHVEFEEAKPQNHPSFTAHTQIVKNETVTKVGSEQNKLEVKTKETGKVIIKDKTPLGKKSEPLLTELQVIDEKFVKRNNSEDKNRKLKIETGTYPLYTGQKLHSEEYPLFQSTVELEFPTVQGSEYRIPHIIHQIYSNESLPDMYVDFIKSFLNHNPTWQYRFWTYESGRKLLLDRHPYLVKTYDSFGRNDVKKSDMLRYAALYEFGGFYADLDVRNLRPLDITTMKYACIIPVEPFEHPAIASKWSMILTSAIMLCRPKHPLFKLFLKNLEGASWNGYPVTTTGPMFITKQYLLYNNLTWMDVSKIRTDPSSNSPYFYQGTRIDTDDDAVYIPNCQYFTDSVDKGFLKGDGNPKACSKFDQLSFLAKRACVESESRKTIRRNKKYTFTVHYWHHLWLRSNIFFLEQKYVHIKDLAPNCILYGS